MNFLKNIIEKSGNEFATIVDDGLKGSDVSNFVDTGSYILNALISGSIHKGLPGNKITALAGASATGKTYFALGICAEFLNKNPEAMVLYFDTEQAITSDMFKNRGVDVKRVAVFPVATVEHFRHQLINITDNYLEQKESERKPLLVVLDSLGMLSTSKEMSDTSEGKDTKDMTRAQIIKATFRVLTIKLGNAGIPLLITNHTYDTMSMFPTAELSGGQGIKYSASTIVMLSKKKEKVGNEVVGNIIHCKLFKGRFTKENKMVDVLLKYDSGLDRYYGLLDIALKYGIFTKVSTRIQLSDGTTVWEKNINENPEKFFTPDVLEKIEVAVQKEFLYGMKDENESENRTVDN
jgi:RecA/RadA recombinase